MPAWWQTKTEKKKGALGRTKIIPKNANLHFFVPFFITNNELWWPLVLCKQMIFLFPQWTRTLLLRNAWVSRRGWEISVEAQSADSPPEVLLSGCLKWKRDGSDAWCPPAYLGRGPPASGWTACCCRSSWSRLGWSPGWPAGTSPAPGCWRSRTTRPELRNAHRDSCFISINGEQLEVKSKGVTKHFSSQGRRKNSLIGRNQDQIKTPEGFLGPLYVFM